jgi:hypothetical protein
VEGVGLAARLSTNAQLKLNQLTLQISDSSPRNIRPYQSRVNEKTVASDRSRTATFTLL